MVRVDGGVDGGLWVVLRHGKETGDEEGGARGATPLPAAAVPDLAARRRRLPLQEEGELSRDGVRGLLERGGGRSWTEAVKYGGSAPTHRVGEGAVGLTDGAGGLVAAAAAPIADVQAAEP